MEPNREITNSNHERDAVVTFSLPCRLFNTMKLEEMKLMESVMLTIDVEKADDVAVVHCGGRLVRGADVLHAEETQWSRKKTRASWCWISRNSNLWTAAA